MHTTQAPRDTTRNPPANGLNTSHRTGTRSDLARIATARGASRACSASASPPPGSPARRTRKNRNSDQISTRRNQIQPDAEHPGPESNRRDHPNPPKKSESPLSYPLLLRVTRGGCRCGRCGVAVSHLSWVEREKTASLLPASSTRARGGSEEAEAEKTLKSDAAGGASGERERGKARTRGGGWMDR